MTRLLQQALAEIRKLPPPEQDAIAMVILDELADEQRWHEAFTRSQHQLAPVTDKVRDDIRVGRIRRSGMDEL